MSGRKAGWVSPLGRLQVSALALAGVFGGGQALAQEAADGGGLDEIIVVAQKREQALQDVPLAVSAFSAATLERAQIEDAADLQLSIPNAVLTGNDRFTLRGIGNNAISSTADNGVGAFINGARSVMRRRTSFSTSSALKCCAGRKERFTAATPPAGRSMSSPGRRAMILKRAFRCRLATLIISAPKPCSIFRSPRISPPALPPTA
jgi:hypothetical protein